MSVARILVITGASGAGKTAIVRALDARAVRGVRCFYFDSIGVPTAEVMERDYGGGEQWQASATAKWLARLCGLPEDVRVAVLDGQTRPSFVFDAAARAAPGAVHVVLLDCSSDVRAARLRGPRQQPELANVQMDHWAAYLRGQADALDLAVIDTSLLTVTEAAEQLEKIVWQMIMPDHPAADPLDDSLRACEAALRQAQLTSDVATLERLVDDTLVFTGPDGAVYGKEDDLDAHRHGIVRITRLEPSEERIQRFGSIAVVSVRMEMAGTFRGATFAGPFRYTRVWCERPDGWRVVAGHVSAVLA